MTIKIGAPGVFLNGRGPYLPKELDMRQERYCIETLNTPMKADPKWKFVDECGHFHAWNIDTDGRPEIITASPRYVSMAVVDDEDPDEADSIYAGMFCDICDMLIPDFGTVPDPDAPTSFPGLKLWTLRFENQMGGGWLQEAINNPKIEISVQIPSIKAFGIAMLERYSFTEDGWNYTLIGNGPLGRYGG